MYLMCLRQGHSCALGPLTPLSSMYEEGSSKVIPVSPEFTSLCRCKVCPHGVKWIKTLWRPARESWPAEFSVFRLNASFRFCWAVALDKWSVSLRDLSTAPRRRRERTTMETAEMERVYSIFFENRGALVNQNVFAQSQLFTKMIVVNEH